MAGVSDELAAEIEHDIWRWMSEFVASPSDAYDGEFAPCPYAFRAITDGAVDVIVHRAGSATDTIAEGAGGLRERAALSTRVMVFAPRVQHAWGISEFVESLNAELIADNVFLNTGVTKTMPSRFRGSGRRPYFIVVANSLDAVLRGSRALEGRGYYDRWPAEHYEIVVERRARLAAKYGSVSGRS